MKMQDGPFTGWYIVPLATVRDRQFAVLDDITLREGSQGVQVAEVTGMELYRQSNRYEDHVVVDYGKGVNALIALANGRHEAVRIRELHITIALDGTL